MGQDLLVEIHPRDCSCRGAVWMLPRGVSANCVGTVGTLTDAVVISAEQWRSLGKPRSIESHNVALARTKRSA
jgi:hypothetical protein